ncbi:MAG: hypothetical protein ACOYOF_07240 [Verrucomicrobiaceae bacterium]
MNRLLLLLLATVCLSSCGSAFRQEWNAAKAKPIPAGSIAGAWEGSWRSEVNGHQGKLRCVVPATATSTREFYYHATWAKIFSGSMKATHVLQSQAQGVKFTAQHDLGSLGQFTAQGTITGQMFSARYHAAGDHGVFEMQRPKD